MYLCTPLLVQPALSSPTSDTATTHLIILSTATASVAPDSASPPASLFLSLFLLRQETAVVLQQVTYSVAGGYGLGLHARAPASRPPRPLRLGASIRGEVDTAANLTNTCHKRLSFYYFYTTGYSILFIFTWRTSPPTASRDTRFPFRTRALDFGPHVLGRERGRA